MTVRTREQLEDAADVIRDETAEGGNTPARVGGFCRDLVDSAALADEVEPVAALSRVLFVDSASAVTPADGSIRAPFTTLQAAHDAATANSTIVVIACSTGAALSVTKSLSILPWRALIERPFAGYARAGENVSVGAVTVAAGMVLTVTGMNTTTFALPSGGTLNLGQGCDINGAITGTGDIRISRADIHADITGSGISISNSQIDTGVDITTSGTVVSLESVSFPGGAVSIVFSGSPGTVQMDPRTYEEWRAATETVTNGSIVILGGLSDLPNNVALRGETTTPGTFENLIRLNTSNAVVLGDGWVTGFAAAPGTLPTIGVLRFPNNSTILGAATAAGGDDTVLSYGAIGTNFTYLNGVGGLRLQGVGGVAQLGNDSFQFLSLTSAFVVSTNDRSDAAAAPLTIRSGGGTASNNGGKALKLQGGRRAGTGDMGPVSIELNQDSSTTYPMLEAVHLENLRRVLSLVRGSALTTTQMPTDTGDLVAYIGNCATPPSASPVGGGILYVDAGELKFRGTSGSAVTLGPNVKIPAAQALQLIAGTPTTSGPANALIEFLREGGGQSSSLGLGTSGMLRLTAADALTIEVLASLGHMTLLAGASGSMTLSGGSGGTKVTAQTTGKVRAEKVHSVQYSEVSVIGNSGADETIDWSSAGSRGAWQHLTLNANCAIEFTDPEMPAFPLMLMLLQDGTGGRTITLPARVKNAAAIISALSTTASTVSIIQFAYTGGYFANLICTGVTP